MKSGAIKAQRLGAVAYEIRGAALEAATRLEQQGHRVIKLNIGNLAPFGFQAPTEMIGDMVTNLARA